MYTAGSRALAAPELLAYVNTGAAPPGLELFEVHLPDDAPVRTVAPDELVPDWRAPRHPDCRARGDTWAHSAETLLLVVPSAMIPEEPNYLINPAHPAASRVRIVSSRSFSYDPRLQK